MMKRLFLLSCLLIILINADLIAQSKAELKNSFYYAESRILFEDYKESLPSYLTLLKAYPDNSNFKYRIGQCYINTPGEKVKAISYLEDAVKNIDPEYKEGRFRETGAPYDALYYLANAYRINNQLDKAVETYELFKKNLNPAIYDTTIVNLQIQSCLNAKDLMKMPLYIKEKNLGNNINAASSEFNPVVSDNEDMLVFSKSEAFYDAILYSRMINGKWSSPVNMNELLKADRDFFPTSLSNDGKELFLYSSADYDGNIYTTRLVNGSWTPLVKLNDNINTKYWESHATISHDGKSLYFTSNRKGTYGGLDIFVSLKDSTGDWGQPSNLGPVINSPYNEESPFLSRDDKTLFFSSRGHFNMGGYDIFYSNKLDNGQWSVPLNVGYPLNSTDDDVFFKPLNEGYEGYFSKESPDGFGKQDIYRIEIFSENHPRRFFVKGMAKVDELISNINDSVKISALNIKNPNQTLVVYSNPKTGVYEFELPQGSYKITYESSGAEKIIRDLDLPLTNSSDSFILPGAILPKMDFVADLNVGSEKSFSVVRGDSILFPLKAEPNSVLTAEHWAGDSLISVEQFLITNPDLNYKMAPAPGDNKVVFKLTDKFNNTTSTNVFITREKDFTKQHLIRPEYSQIISDKQISAFISMLKNRASDKLLEVISNADTDSKQFRKADDLISYLKGEAAKKNINPEEIDKLALKVAVMDNVLSQSAVDLMAKYTDGNLKKSLTDLDIEKSNLQTWTVLQEYVSSKTGNEIGPEELNKIATVIFSDIDPSITILRDKILAYSEHSENGNILRQSVTAADLNNIKINYEWLRSACNESLKKGLTQNQLAEMLAVISSLPETDAVQFLKDLVKYSEEPLTSSLKAINLKKENIKSPKDLIMFLMTNKVIYPEEDVFKSIANLIIGKNIPADTITSQLMSGKNNRLWILWIIIGASLFIYVMVKRKKNKEK
ncbi:MAG: tetratricopeptide repeat protein [Bacteroidales bacterium]|nr:tetratricopeptide repeat protein [Bacteroidales bacterium]